MLIVQLKKKFEEFFCNTKTFTAGMQESADLLFSNHLAGQMKMSSKTGFTDELMSSVVVHTYSVISCLSRSTFLQPLYRMANTPDSLAVSIPWGIIIITLILVS